MLTIRIPARFYDALAERDSFTADNPTDRSALAVFKSAVPVRQGRGCSYVMTGEKDVLTYILDYFDSLVAMVDSGVHYASDFNLRYSELVRYAEQSIVWE